MKISFKVMGIFVLATAFLFGFNTGDSSPNLSVMA
jgi:hypothetical protein